MGFSITIVWWFQTTSMDELKRHEMTNSGQQNGNAPIKCGRKMEIVIQRAKALALAPLFRNYRSICFMPDPTFKV